MWTNENRARYDRSHLRYPSDLTDDEWKLVEPLIPPGKRGGDKRTVIMREVVPADLATHAARLPRFNQAVHSALMMRTTLDRFLRPGRGRR